VVGTTERRWPRDRLPGSAPVTPNELLSPRNARVLLGLAVAGSGALLIAWGSHITFLIDDWNLLLNRPGFDAHVLLDPHARHLILGPVVIYKAIQSTIGMESRVPYDVVAIVTFLASVVLLFAYLRQRIGDWVALAAVLPVLVMGSAWEDLLSAFQIGYFGSMTFGIGAVLAIERADRRGDAIACAALVASLAFAEIALAFAAGVAVAIALQRGPMRRVWVPAVPLLLYAVWYPTFGQSGAYLGPSGFSLHNVATSPPYVLDGFASSVGSLLGLGAAGLSGGSGGLDWGRPLLLALLIVAVAWIVRSRAPRLIWVLVPLVIGLSFWFLTAANFTLGRAPYSSRYQYVGAVFLLMIAANLAAGWRPGWRGVVGALAVGVAAALGNLATLHQGYRVLAGSSEVVRGGLAGLEIAADRVSPDLVLTPENSNANYFTLLVAGPYLSAADKFGSPAYSQPELAGAPEGARVAADKVLAAALPVSLRPGGLQPPSGGSRPRVVGPPNTQSSGQGSCVTVTGLAGAAPIIALPPGDAILRTGGGTPHPLSLRRFAAESFPVSVGALHGSASLVVPTDRSGRPWQLQIGGAGPVTACGV
jgi:hypothetical protein